MRMFKNLAAAASIASVLGILAPATVGYAKSGSATDGRAYVPVSQESQTNTGSTTDIAQNQSENETITDLYGNDWQRIGDTNDYVKTLQDQLQKMGFYKGYVDGIFGKLTDQAVRNFQSHQGIQVDGIVGPETKTELYKFYSKPSAQNEQAGHTVKQSEAETPEKEVSQPAEEPSSENQQSVPEVNQEAATDQTTANRSEQQGKSGGSAVKEDGESSVKPVSDPKPQNLSDDSSTMAVEATGYALKGTTATGIDLGKNPNAKVIAVDPNRIPLGTKVAIPGYGVYTAADTGGNIKGNRIDIHLPSHEEAIQFGRQTMTIKILD
ncbi:hypothetical protein EWH99_13270 [Sporolactobacillus sp. THM7-7]|nr:hypothetical protein EWH99_13270 [Sporolactobacillus sp. THM7-7]